MAENGGDWHLDKKVPLGLLVTIILQTVGAVWWAASLSQRANELERFAAAAVPRLESIISLDKRVDELEHEATAAVPRLESVIRLEMQASEIKSDVAEIKNLVNEIHRPRQ